MDVSYGTGGGQARKLIIDLPDVVFDLTRLDISFLYLFTIYICY